VARSREIDELAIDRVAQDLGLPGAATPAPSAVAEVERPAARPRIDLGDIDRYLESLTK